MNDSVNDRPRPLDVRVGHTVVEVKSHVRAASAFREALWTLADAIAGDPRLHGVLLLDRSAISPERLDAERGRAAAILRPEVWRRIEVLSAPTGDLRALPKDVDPRVREELARLLAVAGREGPTSRARGLAPFAVLHVLVDRWLRDVGPVHTTEIIDVVGCSYPTVALALRELGDDLVRRGDRRVELARFPTRAWRRYASVQDRMRGTERYVDRSGSPRSAAELLARLAPLARRDVAIGGVHGALHHAPSLDIVGASTLNLTLHHPVGVATTSDLVARLDPALAFSTDRTASATLVLRRQRLRRTLATSDDTGRVWADPADCLLDLEDAGLDGVAAAFLDEWRRRRRATS